MAQHSWTTPNYDSSSEDDGELLRNAVRFSQVGGLVALEELNLSKDQLSRPVGYRSCATKAAEHGQDAILMYLDSKGVDLRSSATQEGPAGSGFALKTPLLDAVICNQHSTVILLMNLGADPRNAERGWPRSALQEAILRQQLPMLRSIWEQRDENGQRGKFFEPRLSSGQLAIVEATRLNKATSKLDYPSYKMVSFLIEKLYRHLDDKDDSGLAAIHYASQRGLLNMLELLVLHGANPVVEDSSGQTAWEIACSRQFDQICRYLKPTADTELIRRQKWELAPPLRAQLRNTYITSLTHLAKGAGEVSDIVLQRFFDRKLVTDIDLIIVQQVSLTDLRTIVNILLQMHVFQLAIAVVHTIAEAVHTVPIQEPFCIAAHDQLPAQDQSSLDSPDITIDKILKFASPSASQDPLAKRARIGLSSMRDKDLLLVLKFYETVLGSRWAKAQVRINEKVGELILEKCPRSIWNAMVEKGVEAIMKEMGR